MMPPAVEAPSTAAPVPLPVRVPIRQIVRDAFEQRDGFRRRKLGNEPVQADAHPLQDQAVVLLQPYPGRPPPGIAQLAQPLCFMFDAARLDGRWGDALAKRQPAGQRGKQNPAGLAHQRRQPQLQGGRRGGVSGIAQGAAGAGGT